MADDVNWTWTHLSGELNEAAQVHRRSLERQSDVTAAWTSHC